MYVPDGAEGLASGRTTQFPPPGYTHETKHTHHYILSQVYWSTGLLLYFRRRKEEKEANKDSNLLFFQKRQIVIERRDC